MPKRPRSLADAVRQLEADPARVRAEPALAPCTARLLEASVGKAAKKLAEEAVETALDAVRGDKTAVVAEAADLLHDLAVLLGRLGIGSEEVWGEMDRCREAFRIAAKLPKASTREALGGVRRRRRCAHAGGAAGLLGGARPRADQRPTGRRP